MGRAASLRPLRPRAPHESGEKDGKEREREREPRVRNEFLSLYPWIPYKEGLVMILSRERKVGNFIPFLV